ncbi:tetratricopeptide repeat protein [Ralstonia flaminis]|jgi:tetratricopeptide (TPR) repeat protein|uniref:Tetratricopeptide repeat protein n=1 Tax=Ralstonia flaminis TaxID=3058597 RepID=A0ABM9K904_9RALS|nr:tetratricopeptide repeat protein [Ralstonia sp. LMG 18101]CAJ0817759.1 hypothetical protein LMG18101_03379 [Ralstonia sp. LMG 18101]
MINLSDSKSVRDSVTQLFSQGDFEAGVTLLQKTESIPRFVELECIGNMHFYKRELQKAIESYELAISIQPGYEIARYQYLVGTQDERQGDFISAFKRYQSAIDIEPTFVDAYFELGGLLVKVGDFEGAAQCYRDAVKLAPSDLAGYYNLSAVLGKLAHTDPEKYSAELLAVDAAYEKLKESGAPLPSAGKW